MLSNNTVKYSQVGLATLSLFTLIFITATTVTALNPIVEQSSTNISSGQVAGISTVKPDTVPLNIDLIKANNVVFDVVKSDVQANDSLATITVSSENLKKGIYKQDLVKIYNPNNFTSKTKVSFFLPQDLKGKVKIYLEDSKDSLIMYTIEESYGPKTITLPELSERKFKINVEATQDITAPIELVFVFSVGQ